MEVSSRPLYVVYALGTKGDVHPLLGIAVAIKKRGNRVVFLSNDRFQAIIEGHGVEFISVGEERRYLAGMESQSVWDPDNPDLNSHFEHYHGPAFEPAFRITSAMHKDEEVSCVVGLGYSNGAVEAARILSIPSVVVVLSPSAIRSVLSPSPVACNALPNWAPAPVKGLIFRSKERSEFKRMYNMDYLASHNKIRARLGARKFGSGDKLAKAGVCACLFPEWFGMSAKDWPKNLRLFGFPLYDDVDNRSRIIFNDFVARYGAPIIFTTGTGVRDNCRFIAYAEQICAKLGCPGVLVGCEPEPSKASNLLKIGYIDFEYALPRCLAIVHHGGIGTLAQAVRAGIPQLIRPLAFDQPDNAFKLFRLGLGAYLHPSIFTAEKAAKILRSLIDNRSKMKSLDFFSGIVKNDEGLEGVADLAEQVANREVKLEQRQYSILRSSYWRGVLSAFKWIRIKSSRDCTAERACILMVIGRLKGSENIALGVSEKQVEGQPLGIGAMLSILEENGVAGRAVRCRLNDLIHAKLPAIGMLGLDRTVVIDMVYDNLVMIRDPANRRRIYTMNEFGWHYRGFLIECEATLSPLESTTRCSQSGNK